MAVGSEGSAAVTLPEHRATKQASMVVTVPGLVTTTTPMGRMVDAAAVVVAGAEIMATKQHHLQQSLT